MDDDIHVNLLKRKGRPHFFMRYRKPDGTTVERSTKKTRRRDAERVAAKWEEELRSGQSVTCGRMLWEEFLELYHEEKLASLANASQQARYTAINHLQRICGPRKVSDVTTAKLSQFQRELRRGGMKETTIRSHLQELQAMFNWAAWRGIIAKAPQIDMPKRAKGIQRAMRGRPITLEEFERMLQAVPKGRKREPEKWARLIQGLWLSGLRLSGALQLSWDEDSPLCVKLYGKCPKLRLLAEGHKSNRDQLLPIAPDFAEFLLATPVDQRVGLVFGIHGNPGKPVSTQRASRYISAVGAKAGVVTVAGEKQTATAHDLRRAFGTHWSRKVMPATPKVLMQHQCIETTMKYYVDRDAHDVAEEVWKCAEIGLGEPQGEPAPKPAPDSLASWESQTTQTLEQQSLI